MRAALPVDSCGRQIERAEDCDLGCLQMVVNEFGIEPNMSTDLLNLYAGTRLKGSLNEDAATLKNLDTNGSRSGCDQSVLRQLARLLPATCPRRGMVTWRAVGNARWTGVRKEYVELA
jgi:hypothetical protein